MKRDSRVRAGRGELLGRAEGLLKDGKIGFRRASITIMGLACTALSASEAQEQLEHFHTGGISPSNFFPREEEKNVVLTSLGACSPKR